MRELLHAALPRVPGLPSMCSRWRQSSSSAAWSEPITQASGLRGDRLRLGTGQAA